MKVLSQLGIAAHIAIAILIVAVLGGRATYVTLYPVRTSAFNSTPI